jgi:hypothetical protein
MKKLIGVTCGLLVFAAGWCFGQGQSAKHLPGGSDWKNLSSEERQLYVAGYLHGYLQALLHGALLSIEHNAPQKMSSLPADKYQLAMAHKVAPLFLQQDEPTAPQLDPTISAFYSDYRNMPVCFDEAILLSAASLAGNAATDQELDAARKRGAEKGCK